MLKLILRENEGFLHSKLHHAEFENKRDQAHESQPTSKPSSSSVETMKSAANPLLTAKAAAPIIPANNKPNNEQPAPNNPPSSSSAVPPPASSKAESSQSLTTEVKTTQKSNFPNIKIESSMTEDQIEKELERLRVCLTHLDMITSVLVTIFECC